MSRWKRRAGPHFQMNAKNLTCMLKHNNNIVFCKQYIRIYNPTQAGKWVAVQVATHANPD